MAFLNPIASNWSRAEREKLNNNWTIIESYLSNLQGQINLLTGDVDVQKLVDQINDILNQGNVVIADLEAALQDASTVISNAQNATTEANNAAQDALNAINDMQAFINQFGNAESYDNSKPYKINNIVEFDGSGFICIKDTQGNPPPSLSTKRNEWWQLFAQKGTDGTGAVSKVAGKSPDVDGNVPLTAQDVGATSISEFNALPKIFSSQEEPTQADVLQMKHGDVFIVYGDVFGTLLNKYFTGVNGTTPYSEYLNTFSSIITGDAIIAVDTHSIQNNKLEVQIKPTANNKFVIREFVGKNPILIPNAIGERVNLELKVTYPSVRETIFGITLINKTAETSPGVGGLTDTGDYIRLHYSQSDALGVGSVNIGRKINSTVGNVFTQSRSVITNSTFKIRLQLEKTSESRYTARCYENDILLGFAENVEYNFSKFYPLFYVQTTQTDAEPFKIESIKIW